MLLKIKVTTKARRTEFYGRLEDGTIKIRLKSAAEKGRANEKLMHFLTEAIKVNRQDIHLMSGQSNPRKTVQIPRNTTLPW